MSPRSREPSRLPVRGTIAAAGTVGALVLSLSFRGGPPASGAPDGAPSADAGATDELTAGATMPPGEPEAGPVTLTGGLVETRWGDVQVAATVNGSDILDVVALALPEGDQRTDQISDYVEPILRDEAITIDSADVSVISGATYTSRAYATSLQSALDQLGA